MQCHGGHGSLIVLGNLNQEERIHLKRLTSNSKRWADGKVRLWEYYINDNGERTDSIHYSIHRLPG